MSDAVANVCVGVTWCCGIVCGTYLISHDYYWSGFGVLICALLVGHRKEYR
jgi:hypothetical protein